MAHETILKDLSSICPKWTPSQGRKCFSPRDMSALERREIDRMVYELTEKEVVIIEKSN